MGIYGIDISSYQGSSPDYSGESFVFIKVTEGLTYVNPDWKVQASKARAAGLVVGFYAYPHMGNNADAEADFFLSQVQLQPGDMIALDWEGYDTSNSGISNSTKRSYKDSWIKYMKTKLPSHQVGMYCSTDYWLNIDTDSYYGDFLWIATSGPSAGNPGIKATWTFHQYSTAGGVDHDYSTFSSKAALETWALSKETDLDANQANQLAAIYEAVAQPTIPSKIDGVKHSLGDHEAATNGWTYALVGLANKIESQLAAFSAEIAAIKAKIGA